MNKMRWISLLAFTLFFSAATWPKVDAQRKTISHGTPITLWMDWKRGDPHYGKDFIELHRPCEGKSCVCVADFVLGSKENAAEFADYVTSFEHGRVPVVYDVHFSKEGRFLGERFIRVGDWTSDRFHHNDGLLGVKVKFKGESDSSRTASISISSPADCFSHTNQAVRVPDEATALKIAEPALIKAFGKRKINDEKPLRATLDIFGIWTVSGTPCCKDHNGHRNCELHICFGGGVVLKLRQLDGRIVSIEHYK